jgi:hypothetical protein
MSEPETPTGGSVTTRSATASYRYAWKAGARQATDGFVRTAQAGQYASCCDDRWTSSALKEKADAMKLLPQGVDLLAIQRRGAVT